MSDVMPVDNSRRTFCKGAIDPSQVVRVKIVEAPVPILWVDTFVVANMVKVGTGELRDGSDLRRRSEALLSLIGRKVAERKLMCPMGDQEEELLLGGRLVRECHRLMASLSLGIRLAHRDRIRLVQTIRSLEGFIHGESQVQMSYVDAFYGDPIRETPEAGRFIITVNPSMSSEKRDLYRESKQVTFHSLREVQNAVRASGMSYEQQLSLEYQGERDAWMKRLETIATDGRVSLDDILLLEDLAVLLAVWSREGGGPEGLAGLEGFFASAYYRAIPYVDIRSKLWAKLLTAQSPIMAGDPMDVGQLSAIIPYATFVLTDHKMRKMVRELGLDREYKTTVYSMRDFDLLMRELDRL